MRKAGKMGLSETNPDRNRLLTYHPSSWWMPAPIRTITMTFSLPYKTCQAKIAPEEGDR
jgi:hypothetical protein